MDLDSEKISQRVEDINAALSNIKRLASYSDEVFWQKDENIAAIKYYLLQAVEAIGVICVHIAAKKFNKAVTVFGDCFLKLESEKIIDKELAVRLKQMVSFRNKLVHKYWNMDDKLILQYARNDMKDFYDFIKAITKLF